MREKNGNVPTTTASTAAVDALNALGAKRISLATPYPEELATLQEKFLIDNGVEVLQTTWIDKRIRLASEISAQEVHNMAVDANTAQSEAIFISCVALHTIEVIHELEEDLKKPVITSSQATLWRLLRLAHIDAKIEGYGQLLHL